ncbi:MAG TPA: GTPase Era [Desulfobacteraceae bacterium]|nr:GTPase Era [Desulfobacteraceae bacterium]
MAHKSGFVNILGNPNVGKSTLMNALVGQKLSIITSKSQTTRHRILGIVNGDDFQIVYSDTPGIIKPAYRLQKAMMHSVYTAIRDADLIIYVTDVKEKADKNRDTLNMVINADVPVILVINKIDLSKQEELESMVERWRKIIPSATIVPLSAKEGFNTDNLFRLILENLPEGPAYFPKDQLTDRHERFFVTEIIREKILKNYRKEIPYSVEIEIESYREENSIVNIRALIHVSRESQKGIIIGHQGKMLKKTGTEARKDIEEFIGRKVYLEMYVKLTKDWRDSPGSLKKFGY